MVDGLVLMQSTFDKYAHILGRDRHRFASLDQLASHICNYYELIIEHMPGNVYWLDVNGNALGCNRNVLEMFGFSTLREFCGLTFADMARLGGWTPEAERKFREDTLQVALSGKPVLNTEEPPIPDANGKNLYFLTSRVPIFDDNDCVIGVVGISIDITERKDAERLALESELNQHKIEVLWQMASLIAHDLRTPLTSIGLAVDGIDAVTQQLLVGYQLAVDHGLVEPLYARRIAAYSGAVERIRRDVRFSHNYINLILANLSHRKIDTKLYARHRLIDVVQTVLDDYPYINEKYKNDLHWEAKVDFLFWGSDHYLKNVMNNLLQNAYYFLQKAGRGNVHIWTSEDSEHYRLHVKDTALGAPEEVVADMFTPFYTTRETGAGLGLAFCKAVLNSFGGDITASSVEHEFMHFELIFPKFPA